MSGGRFAKGVPEFVYFIGRGDDWVQGPYVNAKSGYTNRKFKLVEVPMDEPKSKKRKAKDNLEIQNS